MKYFNIEGACDPKEHYMVDLQSRLERIKVFIERGKYFSINRARQYGKTTVLTALAQYLSAGYIVISMDFQMLSHADFKSETNFVQVFIRELFISISDYEESIAENTKEKFSMILHGGKEERTLSNMFRLLSQWIENLKKPVVLIIDEVDSASNNQVFLDFLAQLRGYYLQRKRRGAFQSVILAGVYDIKNLQLKIRPQEEHRYNSPWNIAVEFDIDMSFGQKEIAGMLAEYEQDHHTGMEIEIISRQIREYTSGYPFLVSRICKTLDEEYNADWSEDAVRRAVKELMFGTNTLFDDVIKKIENDRKFSSMVEKVIFSSKPEPFRISNPLIGRGVMFGIFSEKDGYVVISNKLFEMYLYEYFISVNRPIKEPVFGYDYLRNGVLDMEAVIRMFQKTMRKMEGNVENFERFVESQGRLLLIAFLTPILNGNGHYVIESWAKDRSRMDIQIFYGKQEEIIELKIWHGQKKEQEAYDQLVDYMENRGCRRGYLVNFCFLKKKEYKAEWVEWEGREIFEVNV